MLVLGFDLETGESFDVKPEENFITELGAVLWDTEAGMPVQMMNTLISDIPKDVHPEATEYTGINTQQCKAYGIPLQHALEQFRDMCFKADYLMAHNGRRFDIPVIYTAYQVEGMSKAQLEEVPLIDSMSDIEYPNNCKQRSLSYLAAFHLILNCFPHRAVTDVLTMLSIAQKYDWNRMVEMVNSPIVKLVAQFQYPNERRSGSREAFTEDMRKFNHTKDAVKKLGFGWNPESKQWILESRAIIVQNMEFPCPVTVVK